jgi:glutathione synthase
MRIAFIADEITTFIKDHDSTWALMQAASQLGDEVYYANAASLKVITNSPAADLIKLDEEFFKHQSSSKVKLLEFPTVLNPAVIKLDEFDLVFMRKDPPVDMNYLNACQILGLCRKALVVNNPNSIIKFNEKLSTLNFPELIPLTLITRSLEEIKGFLAVHKKIVIKPIDQMGGRGVFSIELGDQNTDALIETATNQSTNLVIVQEYLPEIKVSGDKRIIMINGKPAGAILRIPPANDFRANLAAGGSCVKYDLTEADVELCKKLEAFLVDNGIYLAGIDVIGNKLTEINITSPTCLQEINRSQGLIGEDKLEFVLMKELKHAKVTNF